MSVEVGPWNTSAYKKYVPLSCLLLNMLIVNMLIIVVVIRSIVILIIVNMIIITIVFRQEIYTSMYEGASGERVCDV